MNCARSNKTYRSRHTSSAQEAGATRVAEKIELDSATDRELRVLSKQRRLEARLQQRAQMIRTPIRRRRCGWSSIRASSCTSRPPARRGRTWSSASSATSPRTASSATASPTWPNSNWPSSCTSSYASPTTTCIPSRSSGPSAPRCLRAGCMACIRYFAWGSSARTVCPGATRVKRTGSRRMASSSPDCVTTM